jgi:hypothetical protein
MIALRRDTTLEALTIIRRGGVYGVTLAEFASRWPSVLPPGKARRTLRGVGQVTGALVGARLVQRSSAGRSARFTLTAAGETFLTEVAARLGRAG